MFFVQTKLRDSQAAPRRGIFMVNICDPASQSFSIAEFFGFFFLDICTIERHGFVQGCDFS